MEKHLYTQKVYPTINNDDLLEFRVPPNQKGQVDLGNVLLHFKVKLPSPADKTAKVLPQNFFGPKQFSSLEVRINGEAISRRSCANEYFLATYFQYLINYNLEYQLTGLRTVGMFDYAQSKTAELERYDEGTRASFISSRTNLGSTEYEIVMPIDSTIFNTNNLLPSETGLDLSFERNKPSLSTILTKTTTVSNEVMELKDCYLMVPFKHSEEMFQLERNAIQRPLKIKYDEFFIKRFNIPKGSSSVMMSDILTGALPKKLFWGLQTIFSYSGSNRVSSTRFNRCEVKKANLYINGQEADDYPVTMTEQHVSIPFVKFLESTNQYQNGYMGRTLNLREYEQMNMILSATLQTESGSISFEFDFEDAVTDDLVLIVCGLFDRTLKIDNHRNFQII